VGEVSKIKKVLITGAAGFIGSHVVEHLLKNTDWDIIAMVRLNYAGDIRRIAEQEIIKEQGDRVKFVYHDLKFSVSPSMLQDIGEVDYILHLAANSHVDRSIDFPMEFAMDNCIGSVNMLEAARKILKKDGKFINFLTDEVFGPAPDNYDYKESDRWRPSNPYSASKAGQGAFGISYHVTYGLPVITTYCMNVFGERQNSEKFIPKIMRAVKYGTPLTIHCKIENGKVSEIGMRHWLHARNAADALLFLLKNGKAGEHYNIVGDIEFDNLTLARKIATIMGKDIKIEYLDFHATRPGHDRRYSLSNEKIMKMGWVPPMDFDLSLKKMIDWTLKNEKWLA
jgi:dTDP-glucose 4,6-dehydratase